MLKPSLPVFFCSENYGLSTHAYTHKLVYSQTLVWRPFSFFSNWHVSKKKPKRVPDTLFSLFFFMSYREGSLLACSSRQGRPLLRKAHSERGWETPSPSPCIYLLLPIPNGYIIPFLKIQPKLMRKQRRQGLHPPPVYVTSSASFERRDGLNLSLLYGCETFSLGWINHLRTGP